MSNTSRCSQGPSDKPKIEHVYLSSQTRVRKQAKRVFLVMVDDDEDDCILVEAALKDSCSNCTFRCIHDGQEMIDYLQRSGPYQDTKVAPFPDIILLDLNMPRMNGRELLKRLKTDPRFRAIPVIILTTSSNIEDIDACYDLGANSYIIKLSSFEGLRSAIETIKHYWLEVATLPSKVSPLDFHEESRS